MAETFVLAEIAELIGGKLEGDPRKRITGVNTLEEAGKGDIVYLQDMRYRKKLESTGAAAAILPVGFDCSCIDAITVDRPKLAFAKVIQLFHPVLPSVHRGIHRSADVAETVSAGMDIAIGAFAVVSGDARLGDGVVVGSHCFIGEGVEIGAGSYLFPGVVVREGVTIGKECIIHSGAVLGSDGFGFDMDEKGRPIKIPQIGKLVIEDDVEIGANVTVDRATIGITRIGKSVKLDNLVHIAHNVQIGENSLLCAQVGIAGSTTLGKGTVLGGQAGLVDHLEIGNYVRIAAQAGVSKSVKDNETISGYPARPHRHALKREALLSRLEKMYDMIKAFGKRIDILEGEVRDEKQRGKRNK